MARLTKILSLAAVLALLLETSHQAFFVLWAELDRASFAEAYCINYDKPQLDCGGSCRLSAELHSLETPDAPAAFAPVKAQDPTLILPQPVPAPARLPERNRLPFPELRYFYTCLFRTSVFRPPAG